MKYRFASSALQELREAVAYYEDAENGLGGQFLDEIEAATERILAVPEGWRMLSKRTRCCRTHRFPFGLIYQIRPEEILILAVMDLRRDPKRWQSFR